MWIISVFIKLINPLTVLNLFEWLQARQHSINPSPQREIFSNIVLRFLSAFCFMFFMNASDLSSLSGKTNLNGGTLAKRSQGFLRCQVCSMQRVFNREWILDNGNCRPLLHKPCVHVWGWEQDSWVMENNTDALSFICSSVCRCFRVWVFFCRIETILTQIVKCNSMQQFT